MKTEITLYRQTLEKLKASDVDNRMLSYRYGRATAITSDNISFNQRRRNHKMLNLIEDNTQFTVTFTGYEISQILSALLSLKSSTRNHDVNRLCSALLDAFQRSLNN